MTEETKALTVVDYFQKNEIVEKFKAVLGEARAKPYIQSVLIAVANSAELQKCTPQSVARSALRAASLELSCDPATRQAHLVPYNRKNGDSWIKEAQFQPHYNGLYTLAMRTGKYWVINVSPVFEGQEVFEDVMTGLHHIVIEGGLMVGNEQVSRLRRVTKKESRKVIGWLGYFKTVKGFEKTVYMDADEIEEHARKYSKSYQKDLEKGYKGSKWSDADVRETMEKKTVLLALLRWADLSGTENDALKQVIESADNTYHPETIDAEAEDVEPEQAEPADAGDLDSEFPPMPEEPPAAMQDDQTAYIYNSLHVVEVVMNARKLDKMTARQVLKEGRERNLIADMLTDADARAFAATLNA